MDRKSLVLFLGGGNSTDAEVAFREVINILKVDLIYFTHFHIWK